MFSHSTRTHKVDTMRACLMTPLLLALLTFMLGRCDVDDAPYSRDGGEEEERLGWGFVELPHDFGEPTHAESSELHTSFRNIWFHGQQFYAMVEANGCENTAGTSITQVPFLTGQPLVRLPVSNLGLTLSNLLSIRFDGLSVALEHPYNAYPEDLTFWAEAVLALLNSLSHPTFGGSTSFSSISRVIVPNLPRSEVPPWALDVLKLAIGAAGLRVTQGVQTDPSLPELLFLDDLNLVNMTYWVLMDELITPLSRYNARSSQTSSRFESSEVAQRFRSLAYASVSGWQGTDKKGAQEERKYLTLLSNTDAPQSVPTNLAEVMTALEGVAARAGLQARHVEISGRLAPAAEGIRVMQETQVLVGRTGAVLVNAMFLPSGSSLLELIPYNWAFLGLDAVYRNITLSVGDLNYSSWRAENAKFCSYQSRSDARFANWEVSDCITPTCLEVHARAGMIVDTVAMVERLTFLLSL